MTFRKTLSRVLLAVMLCLAALPVFAQEDQPPAIPDPEDEAAMEEQMQAEIERWQREFESRSVYDFRIAYLIAPDALPDFQDFLEQSGYEAIADPTPEILAAHYHMVRNAFSKSFYLWAWCRYVVRR